MIKGGCFDFAGLEKMEAVRLHDWDSVRSRPFRTSSSRKFLCWCAHRCRGTRRKDSACDAQQVLIYGRRSGPRKTAAQWRNLAQVKPSKLPSRLKKPFNTSRLCWFSSPRRIPLIVPITSISCWFSPNEEGSRAPFQNSFLTRRNERISEVMSAYESWSGCELEMGSSDFVIRT